MQFVQKHTRVFMKTFVTILNESMQTFSFIYLYCLKSQNQEVRLSIDGDLIHPGGEDETGLKVFYESVDLFAGREKDWKDFCQTGR